MLTSLLSISAAFAYGVGDFFGALASKKTHPIWVSLIGNGFYAVTASFGLLVVSGSWSSAGIAVGVATGAFEAVGFLLFYFALAFGPVAIVSPLVSVIYAVMPVLIGALIGNQITWLGWLGIGIGCAAVLALSIEGESARTTRNFGAGFILLSVVAGVTWGLSTVTLSYAPKDAGMIPIFIAGCTAFALLLVTILVTPKRVVGDYQKATFANSATSGVMFALANFLIISALRNGQLALVGILTSLYPLATVLLARFVLKEQISRLQWLGIWLAVVAAALLSQG